ncbi:MAG TPA: diacylglycerol kinase family protein [Candidatus Dormibacteraeota bacterium]|nr:diacylglycerol kinase family protein [Candidatus Dormibacteraeota bacterium]
MSAAAPAARRKAIAAAPAADRVVLYKSGAAGITPEVLDRLRQAFPDFEVREVKGRQDVPALTTRKATVIVAGGDGTIGTVARALAGSKRRLAILPLGTYNNFARALGVPEDLDAAIALAREGHWRPVTLGRVNGRWFLEAAAIGMFGEAIALGEKAKDGELGSLGPHLRAVAGAEPFEYTLRGDLEGSGRAVSLVFTNTPTTGTRMPVGSSDPTEPYLELAVRVGSSRTDLIGRMLASMVRDQHQDDGGISFRFRKLEVHTRPRVRVYADNKQFGRTPVKIEAVPGALKVILP